MSPIHVLSLGPELLRQARPLSADLNEAYMLVHYAMLDLLKNAQTGDCCVTPEDAGVLVRIAAGDAGGADKIDGDEGGGTVIPGRGVLGPARQTHAHDGALGLLQR
jgi:hypothetical protein